MNADFKCMKSTEYITEEGFRAVLVPLEDAVVELRYYDSPINNTFRSWKIPFPVLWALCSFWQSYRSGLVAIPAVERVVGGEFRMICEKSVTIKMTDSYGNLKMSGADLPTDLVASLFLELPR